MKHDLKKLLLSKDMTSDRNEWMARIRLGNLHERVTKLRYELDIVQKDLDIDPLSLVLYGEEALYLTTFNQVLLDDRFECVVGIYSGINEASVVPHAFVKHYMEFLGVVEEVVTSIIWNGLFAKCIDQAKAQIMTRMVTDMEVQSSMFLIGDFKARGNSSKKTSMTNVSTSSIGTFSYSNSFVVLNVYDPTNEEVESEGKCVLVDDDGKPLEKVDYLDDHDSENEVEPVNNEMTNFLASKPLGVGYGTQSLLEQYRKTYGNVMEIPTLMLKHRVHNEEDFEYHNKCHKQKVIYVCFAYDFIMFSHGDGISAYVLLEALNEFKCASGLVRSIPKSNAFFCNVVNHDKTVILQLMLFEDGTLHIKYLVVPLISSRLLYRDSKVLLKMMQKSIHD
ncbi:hypothetical protein Tco_0487917 [Tanacetum coccineum]